MKIIKRNGAEEEFSIQKIAQAISKANKTARQSFFAYSYIREEIAYGCQLQETLETANR